MLILQHWKGQWWRCQIHMTSLLFCIVFLVLKSLNAFEAYAKTCQYDYKMKCLMKFPSKTSFVCILWYKSNCHHIKHNELNNCTWHTIYPLLSLRFATIESLHTIFMPEYYTILYWICWLQENVRIATSAKKSRSWQNAFKKRSPLAYIQYCFSLP